MQTELEKRIEYELEAIWNGERSLVDYRFKNFDNGFRAGAKFILEMPEMKEAFRLLRIVSAEARKVLKERGEM